MKRKERERERERKPSSVIHDSNTLSNNLMLENEGKLTALRNLHDVGMVASNSQMNNSSNFN